MKRVTDRAFKVTVLSLALAFLLQIGGFALALAGKLVPEYVQLAAGFATIVGVALAGIHGTNVTERITGKGLPSGQADEG